VSRGPDFIGVGTQRSGTTWWFESLLEHPQVVLPRSGKKELHYFQRFCTEPMTDAHVEHYRSRFDAPAGAITGEWTPRYMHDFWTPRLLLRAAPDAKLLVMLRDPVERFRSGVPHRKEMIESPHMERTILDAIERGRYHAQLSRVLAVWPRERVLVLQYERCVADPAAEYGRTLRFLGVDDGFVPADFTRSRGVSHEAVKEPLWDDLEAALLAALEPDVRRLGELLGDDLDLRRWRAFEHLAADAG
jgi:hypothetical protein